MKKREFLKRINDENISLSTWVIETDELIEGEYVLGCYYDKTEGVWKVYKNGERDIQHIRLITYDEEEAFNELYSMIKFRLRVDK